MPQRRERVDVIVVATAPPLERQIPGISQVSDDTLHRTLGDPHPVRKVSHTHRRITDNADQYVAVVREKVPFPATLGYICLHFCEDKCRRGEVSEAIAIRPLKRFAAEHDTGLWKQRSKSASSTGKQVAVVGSGPAGLTAAYYLAKAGHSATILEALPEPGGMMRVGIPDYRLPKDILNAEIEEIKNIGVDIRANTRVDSPESLLKQGYNAIFLAIGAHQGISIGVEGEDSPGVKDCVSFLREVSLGREVKLGNRVAVIGGGNAAIDSARTALRLGAKEVTIVYRRTQAEMPASPEEIEAAIDEGVKTYFLAAPSRIISQNGELELECIRMELGAIDDSGRRRPEPIKDSEFNMSFDTIIAAIGQRPEISEQFDLPTGRGNTIQAAPGTLATSKEGIFAGGDAVTGPASVIEAIAAGRRAAQSIDKYLGGSGVIDETLVDTEQANPYLGREEGFADKPRVLMPCLPLEQKVASFSQAEATEEAKRCLRCELRLLLSKPILAPKEEMWIEFTLENVSQVPEAEGVYQLLDEDKSIIYIKGVMNLRQGLEEQLEVQEKARYFVYKEEPMYTKRESELLQQYLAEHGEMPEGNRELEDLF